MRKYFTWLLKIVAAVILLQTLFFKFTAAPESVYIFSRLGLEPIGRIGTGIAELCCALLLIIPGTTMYGAMLGSGLMTGAIFSHLMVFGVEVAHDGGELFVMAIVTMFCCGMLLLICRSRS